LTQRDVGCDACGALLPMEISSVKLNMPNVWYPGKRCPMCGSDKFFPVIAITETDTRREEPTSLKRRLLLNPWTGIVAFVVAVGVVVGILVWPRRAHDTGEKALFYCEADGDIFLAKKSSTQPVKCPRCGQKAGYRAAVCMKCSLIYGYDKLKCPYCGSTSRRPLKTMDEVARLRKAHEEYRKQELENNEVQP
jgi:RNA polymerase subunit RPABC4/transcription elongation factor Spt4